jgi:hypothetical protein
MDRPDFPRFVNELFGIFGGVSFSVAAPSLSSDILGKVEGGIKGSLRRAKAARP